MPFFTAPFGSNASNRSTVSDSAVARRLRVLSVGCLVVLGLGLPTTTAALVFTPDAFMGDPWLVYGLYGLIFGFYLGTKTRFWRAVLWAFAVVGTAATWAMLATSANGEELMFGLVLALLPFGLAVLVPDRLALVAVVLVSLVGAVCVAWVVPELDHLGFAKALCLVLVVGLVIVGLQELARADRRELANRAVELQLAWAETEKARAARSRFLTKVQHELRTPLNGVIGAAQVLQEVGGEPLVLELAGAIRDSGDRLAFLVEDVLAFVAGSADDIEVVPTSVRVPSLLDEIVERSRADATRLGVRMVVEAGDVPTVMVDRTRVGHIVGHLVRNAVRHADGGRVRVSYFWLHDELLLVVSDDGPGMDESALERVFAPLSDDVEGSEYYEGLGLGLATSRLLANAMGGTLEASSEPGVGSTFSLKIPAPLAARRAA